MPKITELASTIVDKVRLQRVVNVMQQFLGFPSFNIDSMLLNG